MSTLPVEPWPVWEDGYINSFKWNDLKVRTSSLSINKESLMDPMNHGEMPISIPVSYWERPNYDDKKLEWTLYPEDSPLDLIVNNSHLMKNKIIASIISSIQSLEELGKSKPFEPDHQGQTYVYNGGPNWKPWNHIYYMTKAGKGSSHVLKINKSGVYFVRLFYMGHWRRIVVDDFLPYNEEKELCLPCSRNKFNLWPQILTKALFQIASLSWGSNLEDFSVVACLTGWIYYVVDCRNLGIDSAWKLIQMYMIEDTENYGNQSLHHISFCYNNPSQPCSIDQEPLFCSDCIMWRNIFAVVSETEDQLDRVSPSEEHIISIIGADIKYLNDLEEFPPWKKFRWVDWARYHGGQRDTLGIIKRRVKVYSPFRKFQKPNPYSEENVQKVSDKVIAGEITSGHLKDLLIAQTELVTNSSCENLSEKDICHEKLLEFDFSILYPFIREFHIYYKSAQFKYIYQNADIEAISFSSRQSVNSVKIGNMRDNHVKQCFYFYSESKFCKDFFITLSTYIVGNERPKPYITCEEYNWKSQVQGRILFDLSTFGTITHVLQLGSSVQVCRLWYSLPAHCYFSVYSCTPFEILNEEALQVKLTTYSETFLTFGEKIAKAFELLKQATLNSSEHYRLLNIYKKSFYPPSLDSLSEGEKINFIEDFNEVFDECLAELIFEEHSTIYSTVACLEAQKVLFNNNEVFMKFIDSLNIEEKSEILLVQDQFLKQQKINYSDLVLKELNCFKRERNVEGEVLIKTSSSSPLSRTSGVNDTLLMRKKLAETQFKVEDIDILSNAKHNITLLRKILNRKNKYLSLYPFKDELELKMQYVDYTGSEEFIPLQKWHLITRYVMNIHSSSPVPCRLVVKSAIGKIVPLLFDIDSSKLLSPSFNGVYYVSRKKVGYGVLLYICPTEEMICKPVIVKWNLRITGIQKENILHACYRSPLLCKTPSGDYLEIISQSISGFYIPNFDSVIGRFQIKTKSSPLVTLFVSIARSDIWIRIVIRGEDVDICSVEGKGSLLIPVLILDKERAVKSTSDPDVSIFKGEIQLMDNWKLTTEEQLFVKYLRSIPEKDSLSLEDFDDCPAELISFSSEEADLGESEFNFSEKPDGQNLKGLKKKPSEFNLWEISGNSDNCLALHEKEFESEPYGLLTYSPYWRISLFIDELNKEDTVILHDDQRLKEFEMFEISWEENDPGRGKKGDQLRNDFLKIKSEDFLKMQLDPDELSISDFSECGIDDDFQNQQQMEENEFLKMKSKQKKRSIKNPMATKSIETDLTENFSTSFISTDVNKLKFDGKLVEVNDPNYNNGALNIGLNSNFRNLRELTSDFELSKNYSNTNSLDKLKLDGTETINKPELADLPAMSILSELPPLSKLEPIFNLYSIFCLKNEPMQSPESKSLTMKLIKNYSQHSYFNNFDFNYFDPDDFNFQEPQIFGEKKLSFKELNDMCKNSTSWEILIENVIEPSLYPLSKRKISPEIFDLEGSSIGDVFISGTAEEQILNYKREADELIQEIQRWMLSKTRQGSQIFYPLTSARSQTFSEKLKKFSEITDKIKAGLPKE